MQRVRFWILCAMGAILVVCGLLLFGAHYWSAKITSLKNMLPAEVDMRLDNLTLNESGADGRTMIINADQAHYYKNEDLFILDRVRAKILTNQGNYDILAEKGRYEQQSQIIELTGSIRVADSNGGVLISERLLLKFEEHLLISDDEFCYSTPTIDLEGSAFVFNTKEKTLQVDGRTHLLF